VPTLVKPLIGHPTGLEEGARILRLGISIFFSNRGPFKTSMKVKSVYYAYGGLNFEWEEGKTADIAKEDTTFANMVCRYEQERNPALSFLDHWQAMDPYSSEPIYYRKVKLNGQVLQMMSIGRQLRRVIVDADSDSFTDYELWDTTKDGVLDTKAVPNKKQKMVDWKKGMITTKDTLYFR